MVLSVSKHINDVNRSFLLYSISIDRLRMDHLWIHKGSDLDWDWLFVTAKRNKVTGIFIHNLKKSGIFDQIPAKFRSRFDEEVIKARENFSNATITLKQITKEFQKAQIPLLVFKGGVFAEDLYEDPAHRPFFDIDLLVPKIELQKSEAILSKLDYRFYCPAKKLLTFIPLGHSPQNGSDLCFPDDVMRKIYLSYHFHFPYVVAKHDRKLHVDLHWHVFKDGIAPIDEQTLWKYTKKSWVRDIPIETFIDEAAAVFCAVRIAIRPTGDKLIILSDLMRLLNRIDNKNSHELLWQIAREWGAQRHFTYALKLVNHLFQFDISRPLNNDKPDSLWSRALFRKNIDRSLWMDEYSASLYIRQIYYSFLSDLELRQLPRKSTRALIRMGNQYFQKKLRFLLEAPKIKRHIKVELGRHFLTFFAKNIGAIHQIKKVSPAGGVHRNRCAYKITLSEGGALKVRSLASTSEANRIFNLARFLDQNHFAQVCNKYENKLLIEWIEGKPLESCDLNRQTIAQAAQIHAQLHNTIYPEHLSDRALLEDRYWLSRLEKKCNYLLKREIITEEQGHALTALAHEHLPQRFDIGLTHCDFHPDHLIRDNEGQLKVIDLELISVSAISFDLARTVYLWPMSTSDRQVYFEAYRQIRGVDAFFNHFLFWIILVLVESAAFRDQAGRANKGQTVDQIKAILKSVDEKNILNMYGLKWGSSDKVEFAKS